MTADTRERVWVRARRNFTIGGSAVKIGEVIDLAGFDLPVNRATALERSGFCERITIDANVQVPAPVTAAPEPAPPAAQTDNDHNDDDNQPGSDAAEFPAPSEWTEASLYEMGVRGLADLLRHHGLSVRGSKPERVDRLLKFQQEGE